MYQEIEQIVDNALGCQAEAIERVENVPNNKVYKFVAAGQRYILKFFKGNWPEDGKLSFVDRILSEYEIPHAELITFNRKNKKFPAGYLIEREVQGITADRLALDRMQEEALYVKLGALVSRVHSIPIKNFGYIGHGEADYDSMVSFFEDEFEERINGLIERKIYTGAEMQKMKGIVFDALKSVNDLPSVLCHGDLSKKNIIIQDDGALVLIDWDDAMAYNWMADIARFTFWMKFVYEEQEYILFRDIFLEHYHTSYSKEKFDEFEKAFHIYVGLDCLIYHMNREDKVMENNIKSYLDRLVSETR